MFCNIENNYQIHIYDKCGFVILMIKTKKTNITYNVFSFKFYFRELPMNNLRKIPAAFISLKDLEKL